MYSMWVKKKKDFLFPNDYMRNFFWTQLLWRPWLSEDMLPCKNVISFPFFICGVCSVRQDYASGKFHTFYLRIQRYSAVFPFVIWSHDRTVITQLKSKTLAAVMYEISDLKKKTLQEIPFIIHQTYLKLKWIKCTSEKCMSSFIHQQQHLSTSGIKISGQL